MLCLYKMLLEITNILGTCVMKIDPELSIETSYAWSMVGAVNKCWPPTYVTQVQFLYSLSQVG